jgi:hypothetical protein
MNFANVYVALDDKDTTFEWLEEAFEERNPAWPEDKVLCGMLCALSGASKT